MAETTVGTDLKTNLSNCESKANKNLLETLQILTELGVETVGDRLAKGAVLPVLLSVQEPVGDFVLAGIEHDRLHATDLIIVQLTGALQQCWC